jgi:hypothetical protein
MSGRGEQGIAGTTLLNRRGFFQRVSGGICGAALTYLLGQDLRRGSALSAAEGPGGGPTDLKPRSPHFRAKATSVIHLFMNGGPSQMDLFDPKPMLDRHHGKAYFHKIAGEVEFIKDAGALMRSPFRFARHGKCGAWVSEVMPRLAGVVDDLAFIRSMFTTNLTHEPALYLVQSGKAGPGRPALGSWVVYGLGSENQNLPAYVVLDDPLGLPVNGVENWHAGFLPPVFQGTRFRSTGSPVLNLRPEVDEPADVARAERAFLTRLDRLHRRRRPGRPDLDARIASYELAARMQLAATDALDISRESRAVQEMYGVGREPTDSYGRRCLMARRLVERGVRFVQLYLNGQIWDNHTALATDLKAACARTDQPVAALLRDLKQRGLLESTLVVWGGEFGRLPIAQLPPDRDARKAGRDHNKNAFCTWMAGAGVKGGTTYGATDELGLAAVEDRVSVPDWHATILHLLGLRHDKLFFEQHGLKEKLTGVDGARVVKGILA